MTSADDILATLDPEQREVAIAPVGPVCVIAGAGTGKTRAITARLAYLVLSGVVDPTQVLAVTFTTKAADQMRARLRTLGVAGVSVRTFHSAALRQLQYFWPRCIGGPLPELVAAKASLVGRAASRLGLPTDKTTVRDLSSEIEWAKLTLTMPQDYPAKAVAAGRQAPAGIDPATLPQLLTGYDEMKRERGVIDFEDVLLLQLGLLADYPAAAAQVRQQYRHFVVDEYQDVSPAQRELLRLWLGERDSVCVVGDPAQTIYSFAGAAPRALPEFHRDYPHAPVIELVRNYRSTPPVVALANAVLAKAESPGVAGQGKQQLVSHQLTPPHPAPTFTEYPDEATEAESVVARIAQMIAQGTRPRDIAVLMRVNALSQPYEQALAQSGIPFVVHGGTRFFQRPEVREAITVLRGAARSGEAGDYTPALAAEVRAVLAGVGLAAQPPAGGAARERWESLQALVTLAEELAATKPGIGLTGLCEELARRSDAAHDPVVEGVTLATLHAAKGLEWPTVFLVGLTDGSLPISYATTAEQVAEERRLFYVGITRAQRWLALSWSLARTPGARASRRPSRFLAGLTPQVAREAGSGERSTRGGSGSRPRRVLPSTCRHCGTELVTAAERKTGRCPRCRPSYDEELFARLKQWRIARATADSVPAFVVFTDATLTAIAEAVPTTPSALTAISGVGSVKLERYGQAVLDLCAGKPVAVKPAEVEVPAAAPAP